METHICWLPFSLPISKAPLLAMPVDMLVEVVMDLGRPAEARFSDKVVRLSEHPINHDDLAHTLALIGEFTDDNRAGIERTLRRISAIRNRKGQIIGLTLRVGRATGPWKSCATWSKPARIACFLAGREWGRPLICGR